jgi:hypothetical protein
MPIRPQLGEYLCRYGGLRVFFGVFLLTARLRERPMQRTGVAECTHTTHWCCRAYTQSTGWLVCKGFKQSGSYLFPANTDKATNWCALPDQNHAAAAAAGGSA